MAPALRWAAMRAILIFHIVRDKVTRQCPQITTFEEKGEPKWIRTEVPLLIYQPNALPLGQTDTLISKYTENVLFYLKLRVDR